jgi:hypothetical protein
MSTTNWGPPTFLYSHRDLGKVNVIAEILVVNLLIAQLPHRPAVLSLLTVRYPGRDSEATVRTISPSAISVPAPVHTGSLTMSSNVPAY